MNWEIARKKPLPVIPGESARNDGEEEEERKQDV